MPPNNIGLRKSTAEKVLSLRELQPKLLQLKFPYRLVGMLFFRWDAFFLGDGLRKLAYV